jgi:hypothetical protein
MTSKYFAKIDLEFTSLDNYDPNYVQKFLDDAITNHILDKYTKLDKIEIDMMRAKFTDSPKFSDKQSWTPTEEEEEDFPIE